MIQRIQTVFLLLAVILNAAFFFLPIYRHALADPSGWVASGLTVALAFATLLSLYSVVLFRDRLNQIRWVKRAMLFQIIALGMSVAVFFTIGPMGKHLVTELVGVFMLFLALIGQYLAVYFIRKDENLVRSMDRLR